MGSLLGYSSRLAALATLFAAVAVAAIITAGSRDEYTVTAEFQSASQLVGGEQVVVGGVPAGSVEEIALGDSNQALVTIRIDPEYAPLPAETVATVRSTSLAGIASRRVELTLPPEAPGPTIPDGGTLAQDQTVSEVDLDEVFNALSPSAVRDLKHVIAGLERGGRGASGPASRALRYASPLLSASRATLDELDGDDRSLERLIVSTSGLSRTLASRAPELSALVRHLNGVLGAVGRQRAALRSAVSATPQFLREADTALVNLRAAIGDLQPLLVATGPLADRLGPFFRHFRIAAREAVPALRDLDGTVRRSGGANDLVELVRMLKPLRRRAVGAGQPRCGSDPTADFAAAADGDFRQGALGEATCTLRNSLPILAHLRPYTPELIGWFDDFTSSGTLDSSGGIARIAGTFNVFSLSATNGLPELLAPVEPTDLFDAAGSPATIDVGNNSRCPGANERDPGDGSIPFTDGGTLDCDPTQVPVGP